MHVRRLTEPDCLFYVDGKSGRQLVHGEFVKRGETGILLPNNQRQHRTSHAPKDVLPLRIFANYCVPCQPLLRTFPGWIRSSPPP